MEWGYLFILLSSLFICVMSAVRKEYQRSFGATLKSTLVFIGVSSLFVCLIGLVYCLATDFAPVKQADGFIVGLSAIFALILTVNTCLGIFGSKYGSLAVLIMFATLGTLVISTAYGLIADPLKNRLSWFHIVGLCIVGGIIALSFFAEKYKAGQTDEGKKSGGKNGKMFILICLMAFLFNGVALSEYSIFTTNRPEYSGVNFIFWYLFFCVLICAIVLGVLFLMDRRRGRAFGVQEYLQKKALGCAIAYGVVFFLSEFFALTTTSLLPIVIQAPLSFAMNVVTVAIADYVIYKQKLTKVQLVQMALAIISGICFVL